jgi:hypothetical protein
MCNDPPLTRFLESYFVILFELQASHVNGALHVFVEVMSLQFSQYIGQAEFSRYDILLPPIVTERE